MTTAIYFMSYMFTFYDMHILLYVQLDYSTRLSKSIPKARLTTVCHIVILWVMGSD